MLREWWQDKIGKRHIRYGFNHWSQQSEHPALEHATPILRANETPRAKPKTAAGHIVAGPAGATVRWRQLCEVRSWSNAADSEEGRPVLALADMSRNVGRRVVKFA